MGEASIYLRLSREAGTAQTGLISQEADTRALAAEHGLTVGAVHTDDGWSGDRRDRPAFRAWLADAREGRATVLISYHLERVSRGGLAGLAEFLDVLDGRDRSGRNVSQPVRFLSSSDRLDSASPDWTIRVSVMSGLARSERERMAERATRAHKARKAAGRWSGGVVPYGYRVEAASDGKGKILTPDEYEIASLREAGERLVAGESLARVARWLTAHGPAPRRTSAWSRMTVRQALTGHAASQFTPDERRAFAAAVNPGGVGRAPVRAPARLLSGVLLCWACGMPLRVSAVTAGPVYRCNARTGNSAARCPAGVTLFATGAERLVSDAWLEGWGSLDRMIAVRQVDETGRLLALAGERVAELAPAVLAARGAERVNALAALEAAEDERDRLAGLPVSHLTILRNSGQTFSEAWTAGTTEDRRDLIRETVGTLTVAAGVKGQHLRDLSRFVDGFRLTPG